MNDVELCDNHGVPIYMGTGKDVIAFHFFKKDKNGGTGQFKSMNNKPAVICLKVSCGMGSTGIY
jgi:hypothetical protein